MLMTQHTTHTISPNGFALDACGVSRLAGSASLSAVSTLSDIQPVTRRIRPLPFARSRRF